jgi:hypothetical protein
VIKRTHILRASGMALDSDFHEAHQEVTRMRRSLLFAFSVIFGLFLTSVSMADDSHGVGQRAFVGLWQAIDSFDGSTQLLSITCDSDRSCDVRLNDTAFTLSCQNQIGFARSIKHGVLTVDLTLYCSNLDGTSTLAGTQVNEFVMDRRSGTLTNINDDPVPVPNVFHRISR